MSEHRGDFSPATRSSFSRRRRCVAAAIGALGACGLIFGGLARAASASDPVASVRLTATVDVRSSGNDGIVEVDADADLNVEHNPDSEPVPVPDPDPDPTPPLDPGPDLDPTPPLDPGPDLDPIPPPLDPDPDLDPTPLPDPISVPDPGPVVLPDPGGLVPPDADPPVAPGRDPGQRCASSRTTPRCGDDPAGDPTGDIGDPDTMGATTEVHPASVVAGGGADSSPAPDEGLLGGDGDQIAPAAVDSPAGAVLPKTGGGLPTGALRVLGLGAVGRALLSRTGRRFRPSAVAAKR